LATFSLHEKLPPGIEFDYLLAGTRLSSSRSTDTPRPAPVYEAFLKKSRPSAAPSGLPSTVVGLKVIPAWESRHSACRPCRNTRVMLPNQMGRLWST